MVHVGRVAAGQSACHPRRWGGEEMRAVRVVVGCRWFSDVLLSTVRMCGEERIFLREPVLFFPLGQILGIFAHCIF